MINHAVSQLTEYAVRRKWIQEDDRVYVSNLILEAIGAIVILVNTMRSIGQRLKKDKIQSRGTLTEGISSGLGFLLSSEVLKTIVAPDWKEIGMTCAVLAMRAAMTVLIKWEERQEPNQMEKAEPAGEPAGAE